MDLRTVVTLSALLFMTAESQPAATALNDTQTPSTANTSVPSVKTTSPAPPMPAPCSTPSTPEPVLGLLTVIWTSKCEGVVNLTLYNSSSSSRTVCYIPDKEDVLTILTNVCENHKGCKGKQAWVKGQITVNGYHLNERGVQEKHNCESLMVKCEDEVVTDVQGQLPSYKVAVALLCCLLLVLILVRFTKPTVKALQKRLSNRRQNRWIGPTQSHSVSYHRGKSAVKTDGEKRLSYPALERLTVSDSREPSSNRNSGYTF